MPDRPTAGMRLEPDMLPGLIAAYDQAALDMMNLLMSVRDRLRLPEPWTPDVVSTAMFDHYNHEVVDSDHSTYAALRRYEQELRNIGRNLRQMQADYQRTEDDIAAHSRRL